MKFLSSLFKKKSEVSGTKGGDDGPPKEVLCVEDATVSTRGSDKSKSKSKGKSKRKESAGTSPPTKTEFEKIAEQWMASMNAPSKMPSMEEYIAEYTSFYESEETPIILEDEEQYKPLPCAQMLYISFQSFPDFTFDYKEVETINNPDGNKVVVKGIVVSGTHSGAPYTILPGTLPELAPSGKHCVNDEQEFNLTFSPQGKITKCEVIALGSCTGFAGIYTLAGGDLSVLGA